MKIFVNEVKTDFSEELARQHLVPRGYLERLLRRDVVGGNAREFGVSRASKCTSLWIRVQITAVLTPNMMVVTEVE